MLLARLGDPTSHGGNVLTGSTNKLTDSLPTARFSDMVSCPIHGTNSIISGCSETVITDGLPTAGVGSRSACGSVIISGSTDTLIG